jgi:metal-responsive CopG/Arc/MetJ family transcriptional regulator
MMPIYDDVIMRTIIEIPETDVALLDKMSKKADCSRAAIIRNAIKEYIDKNKELHTETVFSRAFGIWKDSPVNALDYEDKIRKEWDRT